MEGVVKRKDGWVPLLKAYWLDYVVLLVFGGISIGLYVAPPAPTRLFPVTSGYQPGMPINENIAYPLKPEIIPMWLSALTSVIFALAAFLVVLFKQRSPNDFMAALMGLMFSLCGSSFFQVMCKWLIGGLRPVFLSICQPDISRAKGQGFGQIYYDRSICRGDSREIDDALQSFPSGHSNAAWSSLLFLFFYLNAKLKLHGNRQAPYWKLLVVTSPILAAMLLSLSRLLDFTHNWYDILGGSLIGIFYAPLAYRMHYYSIFDSRMNHIPLPKIADHTSPDVEMGDPFKETA